MILVKIGCVVTGYERRLPNVNVNVEEHKFILSEHSSTDNVVIQIQQPADIGIGIMVYRQIDRQTDGQTNGWTDGRTDD